MKKKLKDNIRIQKEHDAFQRLEEQDKINEDDKIAKYKVAQKRTELIEMNRKQLEIFHHQQK